MSAIAGFVQLDGAPAGRQELRRMLDRMAAYRHADGRTEWCEGPGAFGVLIERRTPEDWFELQPLAPADTGLLLAGDFRLDNREALAGALAIDRAELTATPDSALVLRAWLKWQTRCPERLLGDFAFVIWDRQRRTLFCARDHLGVRPFYFTRTRNRFAFASTIKGLLTLPDVPNRLDELALADYLLVLDDDLQRTFHEGISRLPAGHALQVEATGDVRLSRFWTPDPEFELALGSDEEYVDGFRERLTQAVECRMRSVSRTGVMLSGGLDSSGVAGVAADIASRRGETLALAASVLPEGFEGPERDEWPYIDQILRSRGNFAMHRVTAPGAGMLTDLDLALEINDEPFRDMFHYMTRALLQSLADDGSRNVLWGYGGDYVVSSFAIGYLTELFGRGRWATLAHELLRRRQALGLPIHRQIKSHLLAPLLPSWLRDRIDDRRGGGVEGRVRDSAINASLIERLRLEDRVRASSGRSPITGRVRHIEYLALMSRSISEDLEYMAHLSAAMGVGWHAPLLDKRLIEYCLALPLEQKARDGWSRLALRRALEGVVPDAVRWRTDKGPFSPDFDRRVTGERAKIQSMIQGLELDQAARRLIDPVKLQRALEDRPDRQTGMQWSLETLGILGPGIVAWRFLEQRSLSGVEGRAA